MGDYDACAVTSSPSPPPTEYLQSGGPMVGSTPVSPFSSAGGLIPGTHPRAAPWQPWRMAVKRGEVSLSPVVFQPLATLGGLVKA